MQVVLITRQGCHLCDEAFDLLGQLGIHPELRDVDGDDDLFRLYDWRVPVVLANGAVIAEGRITRSGLETALKGSGREL